MLGQPFNNVARLVNPRLRGGRLWQRWIGVCRPNVRRIALISAFEPSTMNRRQSFGSSPRSIRLSNSTCTTAAFSVAPSSKPSGRLAAVPSMPIAASRVSSVRKLSCRSISRRITWRFEILNPMARNCAVSRYTVA